MDRRIAHAESLLDLGRPAEAEDRFRDVLASDPESVAALLGLGRALNRQDQHEEAERAIRSAIALAPEDVDGYHLLSSVLCDRRDGDGAVDAAVRGVHLAPHSFVSHYQYARALLSLRRPRVRDAYDAARRAVELAPHNADCHNLIGLCLDRFGNREGAQLAYRTALSLDPQHTLAQNNLAATELDRGRLGRAAGMLRAAVGTDPQEKQVRDNLDVVLLLLGRRVLWSLFGAAIVLGVLLATGAPWWSRALSGAAYVGVVGLLVHRVRAELPRGVSQWGRGLWNRTQWQGKYLIGLLALCTVGVLLLAFAPYPVAVTAGIALGGVLRILGFVCVVGWIGVAAVNLVRGR